MTPITDDDLYARGAATLLASWQQIARGSSRAALLRLGGVATAMFPEEPERGVYNNALLAEPRRRPNVHGPCGRPGGAGRRAAL